ncbi:MAG: hypothetical protein PHT34_04990 [Oscillospiraceae bacterium]|nr:hypothetical protein [Oscillospiraceae bacterium]
MFRAKDAQKAAKAAFEKLYEGTCVVYGYTDAVNLQTGETEQTKRILYAGPCRLSRTAALYWRSAERLLSGEQLSYDAILFLPPDARITAGCAVTVTQGGSVLSFQQAGDPNVYKTHTEVKIRRLDRT